MYKRALRSLSPTSIAFSTYVSCFHLALHFLLTQIALRVRLSI
jgi:hypothetical protein